MRKLVNIAGLLAIAAAIGVAAWLILREQPVPVDTALAARGTMTVHIEEEGVTRVRDIYTVSAPVAGHLARSQLEEGEIVVAGDSVIASIHPLDPPFLDERTRTELGAAVEAARSAVALAKVEETRAEAALELARSEHERASKLAQTRIIPDSQLERAFSELKLSEAQLASAAATIRLREAELQRAQAALAQPASNGAGEGPDCCFEITSPVNGVVLKVLARSEQAVAAGTPIAEIGDPGKLEFVVDLLSSDAARIRPGGKAVITDWGGEEAIEAVVRRIDPAAFTKVSSLGIEEQRVNAILDPQRVPPELGHGFRVLARMVIWSGENILQVPIAALFRSGGDWAVFVVEGDRARLVKVGIGHMGERTAEILEGVEEGARVVLYPSDVIEEGSLVAERQGS